MRSNILGRLQDGERLGDIANTLGVTYGTVHAIAIESGIRYSGKHLTAAEKAEVNRQRIIDGRSIRQIAAAMGLPKSKIGRCVQSQFSRVVDTGGTHVSPRNLRRPKRCPEHGLVRLWPCVACEGEKRRKLFLLQRGRKA
ncbi:hypothetical protein [Rubripirellula lacrimiformis]|uniref:hypothetical protein n=1 Tax=Rubripirellula lacrimiformis TaxID=1930273 RepID=UPI0011A77D02|nr:hypothetical protein [Rubripirellula lacrimiformis]